MARRGRPPDGAGPGPARRPGGETDAISQRWKESGPGWSHRLRRSRRSGSSTDLEIDAPDYPELMRQAGTLDERNGAPAKDQETIREWMDADAGWKEARAEVEKFVELVGRIDGERKEHEAKCVEAGRLLPAPSLLRSGAKRVYRMAERLESRMDAGERNAHIRAAGKDPDSLDSAVREIHDWLAVQERKQRKSRSLDHDGISM